MIKLTFCDALPGYGPITDLTFSLAKNGVSYQIFRSIFFVEQSSQDRAVPELVAATGLGALGAFTLFQRNLPIRTKRKVHVLGGRRGLWSIPVHSKSSNKTSKEYDSILISTDATPTPGISRVCAYYGFSSHLYLFILTIYLVGHTLTQIN